MHFEELPLKGAWVIAPEYLEDSRGFFARNFCTKEMAARGMETHILQTSTAFNKLRGTFRGMHYQVAPHEEAKYVECVRGKVYDIVIDLRKNSLTCAQWHGLELSETNRKTLYVPKGFAHGYLTLTDDAELRYAMTTEYVASASCGVRWNDPVFNITLPEEIKVIADKDLGFRDFGV